MKKIVVFMVALLSVVSLHAKGDIHVFSVDNKSGAVTAEMVEKAFEKAGFVVGINSNIHGELMKKYKTSPFKIYNAISVYHPKLTLDVMKQDEDAGVFAPTGISVYQKSGEDTLHVAALTAETQAKMMKADPKILKTLENAVVTVIKKLIPASKHAYTEKSLKEDRALITKYEYDLKGGDFEEARETIEETIEDSLEKYGFVMPSYFDFAEDLGADSPYDFFVTYSICKIAVIEAVSKAKPEAAAFAPCTTMIYKKKGEDKIVTGFTNVYNWISSANITDGASRNALMTAQKDFETILKTATK